MSAFDDDFFAVEPPLLARLRALCPLAKAVLSAVDLEGVEEKNQITPAIHVICDGMAIINDDEDVQRWLVVVVAKNLKQASLQAGDTVRIDSDAGRLAAQVRKALRRFTLLPQECQPLKRETPPRLVYRNGFIYVPTLWSVRFIDNRERR